jgi:acetoin utilization deacetylase AcuC-like enzyme
MSEVYYDPLFLAHGIDDHPESPDRLEAVMTALRQSPRFPDAGPRECPTVEMSALYRVHDPAYVSQVEWFAARGGGAIESDTILSSESYEAALKAAGATVDATERIVRGEFSSAFCAVRPPGHHAARSRAMGFCLFNNIAIAAAHARDKLGVERVLIVDWDVHHGNGTQATFERDPSVFFLSLQRFPHFPWSGAADERGEGEGEGATRNIELREGMGADEYLGLFKEALASVPADFKPELVMISAGFDAADGDPMGGLCLTPETYAELTRLVVAYSRKSGQGRIVSVLEGGYEIESLAACARAHFDELP